MQSSDNSTPDVDMNQIKASIHDAIQKLLSQRKSIIHEFTERLKLLESERNSALQKNETNLIELGVKKENVPSVPPLNLNLGVIRKLDNIHIENLLKDFMLPKVEYSSSVLLDYLSISYTDFKKFVQENHEFIDYKGKNKGRIYFLK